MLALLCMWLGISTPLIFLGYYFGYRKQVSYQTVGNVSCKTLPILEWLGPLKFTPVKFGGVGYWMVDKPQISYVVDSWTRSFKIKVKIKVKEHLYCISLHGWVGYCMHLGIVFQFGFLLSKPCFPGMYLWFLYYTEANPQWTWGFLLPMTGFTNVVPYFGCCPV